MRPPASTISVSSEKDRAISARGPTAAMRPSRMRRAPSAMMARERMAGPERASGGPARVTSWRQWTTARSVMGEALQPGGADPRSAADALVGLLRLVEADFVGEKRVQGDPRGPGGPPHHGWQHYDSF